MMKTFRIALLLLAFWTPSAQAEESSVFTLWPLLDYRASEPAQYRSLSLLGPILKHETKENETEYAVRPLFYRATDNESASQTEVLYPVFGYKRDKDDVSFHLLHLLKLHSPGEEYGSMQRNYLFPFLFHGEDKEYGTYRAFFPVYGTLYRWFGRDEISFTLFPLYSKTMRKGTRVDNVLWPFFARISGENESGFKLWPLYGRSDKEGVYRKRMFLWPIFFSESLRLDTDNPVEKRAAWPFYISHDSPKLSKRTWLWPFFSRTENRKKGYTSWNAPWPLVRVTKGEKYHGLKLLPFYSDETMDAKRERWYLWPIYKIEELNSEMIARRRDRVLFFLYSDLTEDRMETGDSMRRVALWPLFGYERNNGVSHLHLLALLEPFFPANQGIERSWAPLWRVYQQKWDRQGNRVVSLLWNLYWQEKQGERMAWELFPLVEYRRDAAKEKDIKLLKGLFRYRSGDSGKKINLFYLPWALRFGDDALKRG